MDSVNNQKLRLIEVFDRIMLHKYNYFWINQKSNVGKWNKVQKREIVSLWENMPKMRSGGV